MGGNIKVGDIVELKSGGPKMTIMEVARDGVWCQWFGGKKLEQGRFPFDSLKASSDGTKETK
jgi:uncharacterized protein YodC (DUF2158 family)